MKIDSATQRSHSPPSRIDCQYMQATTDRHRGDARDRSAGSAARAARARTKSVVVVIHARTIAADLRACQQAPAPRRMATQHPLASVRRLSARPACCRGRNRRFLRAVSALMPATLLKIGDRGALDRLQRAEVLQQRALAGRADAGDFLQAGLADVLLAPLRGASRSRSGAPRRAAAATK